MRCKDKHFSSKGGRNFGDYLHIILCAESWSVLQQWLHRGASVAAPCCNDSCTAVQLLLNNGQCDIKLAENLEWLEIIAMFAAQKAFERTKPQLTNRHFLHAPV